MKLFYVYLHFTPDSYLPFYVGKGTGGRAYDLHNRTKDHNQVVDLHGEENIRVMKFLCASSEEALAKESRFIKELAMIGAPLVNQIPKEVPSNKVRKRKVISDEGRKRIAEAQRRRWAKPRARYEASQRSFAGKQYVEETVSSL